MDNNDQDATIDATPDAITGEVASSEPSIPEPLQPQPDIEPETRSQTTQPTETQFEGVPPVQPQSIGQPAPQPEPKKKSKRLLVAGLLAGALLILGGGSVLAYTAWYQNPDKVVHDAIINLIQAKSMATTGAITYEDEGIKIDLTLDSKSSGNNGDVNLKAGISIDTDAMKQNFEASGFARFIDDTIYFRLEGVKDIADKMSGDSSISGYAAAIIEKIDNRWISVKASDYENAYGDVSKQQECYTKLIDKLQSDKDMKNEIVDLYTNHRMVAIVDKLDSKKVNNTISLGYQIEIDQDAAVQFIRSLENTTFGTEMKDCDENVNLNEIADTFETTVETDDTEYTPTIELWVSRFGHEVTEFSIHGNTSDSGHLYIALQPTFNGEYSVEVPPDSSSFQEVMEDIQSVIVDYYMSELNASGFTMPAGTDSEFDLEFLPAV